MEETTVLIIDDDGFILKTLTRMLSPHFEVMTAKDGVEAFEQLEQKTPSLIVLDVEMPGENGYEVCRKIKAHDTYGNIPVIFLSGNDSLEERVRGYDAGGEDYLSKPCEEDELLAKIRIALEKVTLSQQYSQAQQAAMSAMAGHSNMGILIKYVQAALTIRSVDELGEWCMKACTQLNLNAVACIKDEGEEHYYSSFDPITPLEKELIQKLKSEGRFHDFGERTQINYPLMSLLIKNMPTYDEEEYGRYKDFLPFILEVTESRLKSMSTSRRLHEQSDKLMRSVDATNAVFSSITRSLIHFQESIQQELKKMYELIENRIPSLGLEEDQEQFILNTLDESAEKITFQVEQSANFQEQLDNVEKLFSKLSEYNVALEESMEEDKADDPDDEIEFF